MVISVQSIQSTNIQMAITKPSIYSWVITCLLVFHYPIEYVSKLLYTNLSCILT